VTIYGGCWAIGGASTSYSCANGNVTIATYTSSSTCSGDTSSKSNYPTGSCVPAVLVSTKYFCGNGTGDGWVNVPSVLLYLVLSAVAFLF